MTSWFKPKKTPKELAKEAKRDTKREVRVSLLVVDGGCIHVCSSLFLLLRMMLHNST